MHQTQWSAERPLPPPVSLTSQSHHEKPPEVPCTSRGNPGFPASTRESPRETSFNTSRGQIPLPWLGSNDALPLPPPVSLTSQSHHEKPPEVTCTSRGTPGCPASTRERPRETFFNTSRGQSPLPWLGSNDALPLATRMDILLRVV